MIADDISLLPSGWERPTGKTPLKRYFWKMRLAAEADYRAQVVSLLDPQPRAAYLDCGCNDGAATAALARRLGTAKVSGVEIVEAAAAAAAARGIEVKKADLTSPIPWPDGSFDVITALEVIEHLPRPDHLGREIFRLLKPGGYAVVATENLASWHNIFALLFGWQPFSLAQFSEKKAALGNPFGLDRGESWNPALSCPWFRHCLVLSYRGLKEFFEAHGFVVERILGAGYYPLPPSLASWVSAADARHSAFLTIRARKPK